MSVQGRNPLIFIFLTRVIDSIGIGIVMPVLPGLLLGMGVPDIASATRTAGHLIVTYAALQFLFGPVIGNLSDRFGRRPVILASLCAYAIDYAIMGFAPSVLWLFIGRAIAGMAGAVYVPANAFIADVTPPAERARAYGLVGAGFGLGFVIGPGIGGLLAEFAGPRAPFFFAAGLAVVNALFGLFVLPESLPRKCRRRFSWGRAMPLGAVKMLWSRPAVVVYGLAIVANLIGTNVYPSTWAFFMTARFDWSPGMIGLSLVVTGIAMATVQAGLTGKLVHRMGEVPAAMTGLLIAAAACFAYAFAPFAWMVFVITTVGALQSIAYPALNALLTQQVPPDGQGELQGGIASLTSLANIAGPLVMTQTLAFFTAPAAPVYFPGAAFVLAALLQLAGFALLVWKRPLSRAPASTASAVERAWSSRR